MTAAGGSEATAGEFRVRVIGPDDERAFDEILARHPHGHVQQSYGWGELRRELGWEPIRLVIEPQAAGADGAPSAETAVGAATLLFRRLPIPRLGFLYAPRGPAIELSDARLREPFLAAVRRIGAERGAMFFKLDPEVEAGTPEGARYVEALEGAGFRPAGRHEEFGGTQPIKVWQVDTVLPPDELLARMESDTRYAIRRATRRGVTVERTGAEGLEPLIELLSEMGGRQGIAVRSPEYFRAMWRALGERGQAEIFLARKDDEVVAGALPCSLGDRTWGFYAASGDKHRKLGTSYPLMWEMLRWGSENGYRFHDFGGVAETEDKNDPQYGLYKFKRGFGGRLVTFVGEWDLVLRPALYPVWTRALPAATRAMRRVSSVRSARRRGTGVPGVSTPR